MLNLLKSILEVQEEGTILVVTMKDNIKMCFEGLIHNCKLFSSTGFCGNTNLNVYNTVS